MSLDAVRAVADAVLFEGYALYPYRASSAKNASRWQFGVVAPRGFCEADPSESWWIESQCLARIGPGAALRGKLRFLQLRRRRVEAPDGAGGWQARASIDVGGRLLVAWDEADVREIDFAEALDVGPGGARVTRFELEGDESQEIVSSGGADAAARVRRRRLPVSGSVSVAVDACGSAPGCARVTVRVENTTPWRGERSRDEAVAASLLGAHLIMQVTGGEFASLIDPPDWARGAAAACKSTRSFPVLAGDPRRRDLVLAAPIILYDHPEVAPESPGDLFDCTEIDEILTLRTRTLTEEEKREARAADPRVAALIDRVDALGDEALGRLHGAVRGGVGSGAPDEGGRPATGGAFSPGDRVRLRPGRRRTDAQDMFLDGMAATVRSVAHDVEGRLCLAVTLDDDPAADLHLWHGRFHYFYGDEVERLLP